MFEEQAKEYEERKHHRYEDKDGDYCCDKTKDEIENDIEVYQEYMRYEEECMGSSAKERAEAGLKVARCYGECRLVKVEE